AVEQSLKATNPVCAQRIADAMSVIQNLTLTKEGRERLNSVLTLWPPFKDTTLKLKDVQNLITILYGYFSDIVENTNYGRNFRSIKNLCAIIDEAVRLGLDGVGQVKTVIQWSNRRYPIKHPYDDVPLYISYENLVKRRKGTTLWEG
ncbi:hypothetical protein AB6A40_007376, partial [Gnathostoma spinigerum]